MSASKSRLSPPGAAFLQQRPCDPLAFFSASASVRYLPLPPLELTADSFLDNANSLISPAALLGCQGLEFHIGWHEEGIALQWSCGEIADSSGKLDLYLDTRDRKEVGALTRYCHHLTYSLTGRNQGHILGSECTRLSGGELRPLTSGSTLRAHATAHEAIWRLRCWVPAVALYGYDPDQCAFLGIHYRLKLGSQEWRFCGLCADSNLEGQPGMWASLKLERESR